MSAPATDARTAHAAGVERLLESYRAVPTTAPVRLAKQTSNLFRARTKTNAPGLDTSGLTDVIAIDPEARTADVAGMCTYEDLVAATLPFGLAPLVVPQLKTITLGGAVTGLGIESTSFRSGLPHESVLEMDILTGGGEVVTASPARERRPVSRVPELLRHAGLRRPAAHRAGRGPAVRCAPAPAVPQPRRAGRDDGPDHPDRRTRRHPGRLPRRCRVQRRRELPVRRRADRGIRTRQRLHRAADLLPIPPARRRGQDRPADHPRLSVAMGHRLVLVLRRVRGAASARPSILAAALPAQQRLLEAHAAGTSVRHRRPAREAPRAPAARTRDPGRRGADRAVRRIPRLVPGERADRADLAVPAAAARRRRLAAVPDRAESHLRQRRLLVDGAGRPDRRREQPDDRAPGRRARRPQVALLRRVLLPRRSSTRSTAARPTGPSSSATTPTHDCSICMRRRCNGDDHIQGPRGGRGDGCRGPG